ncbi:MAG: primosomal protein N' [Bacteroidetes bacterium]|nr:primosomal protein N' [Bacteroidota bacterium]
MSRITLFADVLLPLPLEGYFTYRIPFELNDMVSPGKRVVIQFGKKKIYTALIRRIHDKPPTNYTVKYILSVLDNEAIVNEKQFLFWEWIAEYYLCTIGEVMNAALPPAFKLASESHILINPDFDGDFSQFNEYEMLVAEALISRDSLTVSEVSEITGLQKIIPLLKTLIEKGVIITEEEIAERYKPKIETYIRLSEKYTKEDELSIIFDQMEKKAFRQLQLLQCFLQLTNFFQSFKNDLKKSILLKNTEFTDAQIKSLVKKEVFEIYEKEESRLDGANSTATADSIVLNEQQDIALNNIKNGFNDKAVALLHGITSSGKTEIYIKLIDEVLKQGRQVLYLLPEIALTAQIINRIQKFFGNRAGIYHSKYSENQRVEVWNKVINTSESVNDEKYSIVIGARSAIFLPFDNLGLIIVDEEHDTSYKQYDPSPRYNARDAAIYLAAMHGAKTILGSATPAIESYYNALTQKYHLVEINERYGGMELPEILIADLKMESRQKTMRSHFSSLLITQIDEALAKKQQVILFQNRRGFSLRLECDSCHYMPECKNCDVTLIYHKHENQLRCHYCGFATRIPEKCPDCGSTAMLMKGFGTEKVEEDLAIIFPEAKIERMDLDTTRSKNAYRRIIADFEDGKIDILVGTQMITKGLDFNNVGVVGILNADNMISFPDFRSYERSFQLMAQVSGRAGRKGERGKVIIQTYKPQQEVIKNVINTDYLAMFNSQLHERKTFKYPPFYRLIKITLKHKDANLLNQAAADIAKELRLTFAKNVLGPEYPIVSRIKNMYLKDILIKIERESHLKTAKVQLNHIIEHFKKSDKNKQLRFIIDVDPM